MVVNNSDLFMRRRRHFLLLELLIAITLVSLFVVPLVQNPLNSLRHEIALLEKIELDRHAELGLAHIKEKLYQNEIPWEIFTDKASKDPFFTDTVVVTIGDLSKQRFKRSFFFHNKNNKEGKNMEQHACVELKISFTPPKKTKFFKKPLVFKYHLFLTRTSSMAQKEKLPGKEVS